MSHRPLRIALAAAWATGASATNYVLSSLVCRISVSVKTHGLITQTGSLDWTSAASWNPASVPGPGDAVDLNCQGGSCTFTLFVPTGVAITLDTLDIDTDGVLELQGTAALTVATAFIWKEGDIVGPGALILTSGGRILGTTQNKKLQGGITVSNSGTIVWETGNVQFNGGSEIQNFGTLDIQNIASDQSLLLESGATGGTSNRFVNSGNIVTTAASSRKARLYVYFENTNSGVVSVHGSGQKRLFVCLSYLLFGQTPTNRTYGLATWVG
jgi:hypothetical protein